MINLTVNERVALDFIKRQFHQGRCCANLYTAYDNQQNALMYDSFTGIARCNGRTVGKTEFFAHCKQVAGLENILKVLL